MSMSVRDDASGLEYAGARGFGGLFPSWSSLTRPRYLLMLAEVKRFHREALRLLESDEDNATVGEFLDRHGFSQYFIDHFMTPLIAAVWSSPPGPVAALSGALSVRVPGTPRHAVRLRLPDLADGGRRFGHVRRRGRERHRRGAYSAPRCARCDGYPTASRCQTRSPDRDVSTPPSSPPIPTRHC